MVAKTKELWHTEKSTELTLRIKQEELVKLGEIQSRRIMS